jgi:hypothetical protein
MRAHRRNKEKEKSDDKTQQSPDSPNAGEYIFEKFQMLFI